MKYQDKISGKHSNFAPSLSPNYMQNIPNARSKRRLDSETMLSPQE